MIKKKLLYFLSVLCIAAGLIIHSECSYTNAGENEYNPEVLPIESIRLSPDELSGYKEIPAVNEGTKKYTLSGAGANEYGYNSLTAAQKRFFNLIGEKIEEFIESEAYASDIDEELAKIPVLFTLEDGESLEYEDLITIADRFFYSNPKYYFLNNGYSYGLRQVDGVSEYRIVLSVNPYYYELSKRKAADDAIKSLSEDWIAQVRAELNEKDAFYAALLAHDLIIRNINYTYDSNGNPEKELWAHSIAGVFTGQGAVCEGYAKAFEYILDMVGIPNIYIVGKGSGNGGRSEAHAWNAVKYNDAWYLCDVTWDDPNEDDPLGFNNTKYTYFFMPVSLFSKDHTPDTSGKKELYDLPEFADKIEDSFFGKFKCYTADGIDEESGAAFAAGILANRYPECDYVYAVFPKGQERNFIQYVAPHITGEKITGTYSYSVTPYGYVMRFLAPVILKPATAISFEKTELSLDVDAEAELTAIIAEDSDDRILWEISTFDSEDSYTAKRYVKLKTDGRKASLKGIKDGKVVLKATIYSSTLKGAEKVLSAECVITVGTGESSADAVIWQNGIKEKKTYTITTSLKATTWTDAKKKTKKGKLVWFVSDTALVPKFDSVKHTVSFGAEKSKSASVNGKGVVTAKKAGKVFVYVCDTGSMAYEEFDVEILAAPSKVTFTQKAGATGKDDIIKKLGAEAGETIKVYITPYIKDGTVSSDCTYSVKLSKEEQKSYLKLNELQQDDDGNFFFIFVALDFDRGKNKTKSVQIDVICHESNKKASMTVVIGNSVKNAGLISSSSAEALKEKGDKVSYTLDLDTHISNLSSTTDKIKIIVGKTSVSLSTDGKKIIADKGAAIKAKLDTNTMTLTLTTGKKAGTTAVVYAAFTNSITKKIKLVELARIDTAGNITLGNE